MSEDFLRLSAEERREVLAVAADKSGRPAHLLEKDVWVVWRVALCVSGSLRLVPSGEPLKALEHDYVRMVEDGLLLADAEPFDTLMAKCAEIAERANQVNQ